MCSSVHFFLLTQIEGLDFGGLPVIIGNFSVLDFKVGDRGDTSGRPIQCETIVISAFGLGIDNGGLGFSCKDRSLLVPDEK